MNFQRRWGTLTVGPNPGSYGFDSWPIGARHAGPLASSSPLRLFPLAVFPLKDRRCFRIRAIPCSSRQTAPWGKMLQVVGTGEQCEPFRIGNVSFERARFVRNHLLAMLCFERRRSQIRKKGSLSKSTDSTSRHVALFMHHRSLCIRRFNGRNNVVDVVSIRWYHLKNDHRESKLVHP